MKFQPMLLLALLSFTSALSGCASKPEVVQISHDTYMVSHTDKGGVFGSISTMKNDIAHEADKFAASQGKVAIPITWKETPLMAPQGFTTIDYQFRIVDATDPEVKRVSLAKSPDIMPEKARAPTNAGDQDQTDRLKEVYPELIKFDDLRKRGIINDEEFEALKKKLLDVTIHRQ